MMTALEVTGLHAPEDARGGDLVRVQAGASVVAEGSSYPSRVETALVDRGPNVHHPTLDLHRLGGSDVADVLALPGHSKLRPYGRIVLGLESVREEAMDWGTALEDTVARVMAARRGLSFTKPPSTVHPEWEWCRYSPDAVMERAIGEVKCRRSSEGWGGPGTDQVPADVNVQVQLYMLCTGKPLAYVWALFAAQEGVEYVVPFRPRLGEIVVQRMEAFWKDHILAEIPPRWDGSEASSRVLRALTPRATQPMRWATNEETDLAMDFARTTAQLADLEARRATQQQQLEALIGEARGIKGLFGRINYPESRGSEQVDWKAAMLWMAQAMGWTEADISREMKRHGFAKHVSGGRRFTARLKEAK